ncbi:Winged helix DNA-binding domain-containing protein [Saccharopolyspora antimicrobica]|uniref:Winged helix DNA-binding domain-containing protein n=1 Tax=Saccharopolyspora antimicrobica TaxID=455193 RepID=A0A1I4RGY6_9PSEU|nr:MarR family transcriptional regulator [Saccharopolyspora antimicrobica]RKT88014.1 winged helix DNA-binding protein [Saccharopolyspora antimicrobica]SFM51495.1 Winged helix DNA-binding domain-containing protein [Saccharopolyspora antimicrobica]
MPHDPTEETSVWRPLRQLLNSLDDEIDQFYAQRGITSVRPRFVGPLIRLGHRGTMTIRELADALEVTHSAMSQTVAALRREDLVRTATGTDARTRQITLTDRARQMLPLLEAEWRASEAALRELDAEIPYPLSRAVADLREALERRRFRDRLDDHLPPS